MRVAFYLLPVLTALANAVLLIDYRGGQPASTLGSCQLEGQNLGDHIDCPGNSSVYIKPGTATNGKDALTFHRAAHFRRAEVKAGTDSTWQAEKKYFVGYSFELTNSRNGLVIYQWKRDDKTAEPQSNIPFHLEFIDGALNLQVTTPGGGGSNRVTVAKSPVSINEPHKIALAFDTKMNGGDIVSQNNRLAWWVDGKKIHDASDYSLWSKRTGTYPKFGMYRGEADDLSVSAGDARYVFNNFAYRVQISDLGFGGITDSSGVPGSTT